MRFEKFFNGNEKVGVSCKNEKDAEILIGMFENSSLKWSTNDYYSLDKTCWDIYKEKTVYTNNGMFGTKRYIDGDIISFEDFLGLYYDDVLSNLRDMKYRGVISNKRFLELIDISTEYAYKHYTFGDISNMNFDRFFNAPTRLCVSCKTKDEFSIFQLLMDLAHQKLSSGDEYTNDVSRWNIYKEKIVFGNDRWFGTLNHYGGYVMYSFDEFLAIYNRDILNILHHGGRSVIFSNKNAKAVDFITRVIDAMEELM